MYDNLTVILEIAAFVNLLVPFHFHFKTTLGDEMPVFSHSAIVHMCAHYKANIFVNLFPLDKM
jgi:hypothetical protein